MNYEVVITDFFENNFKKLAKKYPSLKNDLLGIIKVLKTDPIHGQYFGKDFYKIRIAISSNYKGTSGGERLITCFKLIGESIFLYPL